MCLTALAWQLHPRFPLVLVANRDEFHRRAAQPMDWWPERPVLAGRDLEAGGTWLGLSPGGRIGLLTNVREPGLHREGLKSRGDIVPRWLDPTVTVEALHEELSAQDYNGFNLLALDVPARRAVFTGNRSDLQALQPGLHGLSNAALNTPWPKVSRLKQGLAAHLERHADDASVDDLLAGLLDLLRDRHQPHDHELPSTGISIEWERELGRVFIQMPDGAYGTRCSTVLVAEHHPQTPQGWRLHVLEQSWDETGRPTHRRRHQLAHGAAPRT